MRLILTARIGLVALTSLVTLCFIAPWPGATQSEAQSDPRFFSETSFRIGNDAFWDFFQRRGGVKTFGFPVSREFTFQGMQVQFFQRAVMQLSSAGSVQTLNLLDDGLIPVNQINGSTFPVADKTIVGASPLTGQDSYAQNMVTFLDQVVPDRWEGLAVGFLSTFNSTVTLADAFPTGGGSDSLIPLLNLELWGAPTSKPARDPNNHNFVYQRFQRRIAHYDETCRCTESILLGDAFKSVITGNNLPLDLETQLGASPFLRQYDPNAPLGLARPNLPDVVATNMAGAFEPDQPTLAVGTVPTRGNPYRAQSPEYGMNVFIWGNPETTQRDLQSLKQAQFGWQKSLFQWRHIEPQPGQLDWREADRVVAASTAAGIRIIARVDFQPAWARADGAFNGPPDDYGDYARFVAAMADRYKPGSTIGVVDAIEIWNEPNLDREWGDSVISESSAADYVRLLREAYTAAKRANPNVAIISAGLSPTCTNSPQARPDDLYLQWMYDAGARDYFDVLGAHGAGYDKPPAASTQQSIAENNGCPVFTFRRVEDLRAVMERNGDAGKQVWLLEFGWTTDTVHPQYSWFAVSPETHAQYLVDAYLWARNNWAPWIGVMTLWNMADPSWGPDREELWWSVTNPDGSPRPAFQRLSQARRQGPLN